jgi:hypothetical protein
MTFEELADLTGRPIKTLRHQRLHGEGLGSVGFKVDGRVLFDVGDVEEYLARCKDLERREREARNGG